MRRHAPALFFLLAASVLACGGKPDACPKCDLPAHCAVGVCTTSCSADGDCGDASLKCASGTCTARCEGVLCPDGNYCDRNTGACIPDAQRACKSDDQCDDDTQKCDSGRCISRCYGVTCDDAAGEICAPRTGTCVGGRGCKKDADCASFGTNEICQENLCVGDRGAACNGEMPCGTGLDCQGTVGYQSCAAPCQSGLDCQTSELCAPGTGGGPGHCATNICAPGGGPGKVYQDAAFMGACNAAGTSDGICVGPYSANNVELGICVGRGTLPSGSACHSGAKNGSADACASALCTASGPTPGVCLDGCSLFDAVSCPDLVGASTTCVPIFGTNGLCVPSVTPVTAPDGACMQADFRPPCTEDHGCIDGTCKAYCSLDAKAGDAGACATGTCTAAASGNAHLGVCK